MEFEMQLEMRYENRNLGSWNRQKIVKILIKVK